MLGGLAAIAPDGRRAERLVRTIVTFAPLPEARIDAYLDSGEWSGKAGGYAIQGRAAAFVRALNGSYSNVVGLPLYETAQLLRRVLILPAVNVLGVNTRSRNWPFDGTDVNRMFPGYDAGETTQRIAAAVLELTAQAKWRIDIHSSNAFRTSSG